MKRRPRTRKGATQLSGTERAQRHAERMLLRARKKAARTLKLVAKWEVRVASGKKTFVDQLELELCPDKESIDMMLRSEGLLSVIDAIDGPIPPTVTP